MAKERVILIDEDSLFIKVQIDFAVRYGVNESIIAGKMFRLIDKLEGCLDERGNKWIRMTTKNWLQELPFFSKNTIIRTLENLENEAVVLTRTFKGRSKWFRLNPAITQNGYLPKMGNRDYPEWVDTITQNGYLPRVLSKSPIPNKEIKGSNEPLPFFPEEKQNGQQPAISEKKEPPPKPKNILRDVYLEATGIPWVEEKSWEKYAWISLGKILKAAGDDTERASRLIRDAAKKLIQNEMTIKGPGSLLGTIMSMIGVENRKKKAAKDQTVTIDTKAYQKRLDEDRREQEQI